MGILLNTRTGKHHVLKPLHVIGRDPRHADTALPQADASLLHATIRWASRQWVVCDHSRNGSFLNGRALRKEQLTPLGLNDEIRFGMLDGTPWRLVDASAPGDLLIPLTPGQDVIALDAYLALPDDETPLTCLYRSASGQWTKDTGDEAVPLSDGEVIQVGPLAWRLHCNQEVQGTLDLLAPRAQACLKFQTSLDEEHVQITLLSGAQAIDMGERSHHYLLLILARQRLQDATRGIDPMAQGWLALEQLVTMMRMDRVHLNIQMFRLRKQFATVIGQGLLSEGFIERRRGGVRLGDIGIELHRGSELEGTWRPASSLAPTPPIQTTST